jgi:hypothetical protein
LPRAEHRVAYGSWSRMPHFYTGVG